MGKTTKSQVTHRSADQIEIDSTLLLASLAPGLKVVRSGLYDSAKTDLTALLSEYLGPDMNDVSFECKSFKSFASSQLGLQYDRTNGTFKLSDGYTSIPSAVNLVNKVLKMQDKVYQIFQKFPVGNVALNDLNSMEIIRCIQDLYSSRNNKGFCIEDANGNLMTFPIYSLSHYVVAKARLRWHRQGSDANFGGTPYIDNGFNQIFACQNCTYRTYRVKENKFNPSKVTKKYYNYLETNAQLPDEFEHVTADGTRFSFKRVGTTNVWQVRLNRPVDATTLCIEFHFDVVGNQRQQDLNDIKYLLNHGHFPKRKHILIRDRSKKKQK